MSKCIYCKSSSTSRGPISPLCKIDDIAKSDDLAHAACHWEHETDIAHQRIAELETVAKKIAGNHCTCGSEKNQCAYCKVYKVIHGRPVHADRESDS